MDASKLNDKAKVLVSPDALDKYGKSGGMWILYGWDLIIKKKMCILNLKDPQIFTGDLQSSRINN